WLKHQVAVVLSALEEPMVLVDVGASGQPPREWASLRANATYVGFDPDRREVSNVADGSGGHLIVLNKAVTADAAANSIRFYFTKNPYCSSTCQPNSRKLKEYLFYPRFEVVGEGEVETTTLENAMAEIGRRRIDWLKLDTQGTDLRVYDSLTPQLRNTVLIIDIEPGLDEWYLGEDVFTKAHSRLLEEGYWLSDLSVGGAPKVRSEALFTKPDKRGFRHLVYEHTLKRNPTYVNARYFRSIEFLSGANVSREQLVYVWAGAMVTGNSGFALDIAGLYSNRFPVCSRGSVLQRIAFRVVRNTLVWRSYRLLRHVSLNKLRRFVKGTY
ncbi:MAG: FkbM family methyltransferase, partial [Pyrinomonadaceae bacterium]